MSNTIAIIGGGVAGISAALAASKGDAKITLYESLEQLGGRAAGDEKWDTGRHLALSSYTSFLRLTDALGSTSQLVMNPMAVGVIHGNRRSFLHFTHHLLGQAAPLFSLLTSPMVPFPKRLTSLTALARTIRMDCAEPPDEELLGNGIAKFSKTTEKTVYDLYKNAYWPRVLQERLGDTAGRSMFNLTAKNIPADPFVAALKRIFTDPVKQSGWVRGDYSSLITAPAPNTLKNAGIELQLQQLVMRLERSNAKWKITTKDDESEYDYVIITVPPWNLKFLQDCGELQELYETAMEMQANRIITIRGQYSSAEALPGALGELDGDQGVWFVEPHLSGGFLVERVLSGMASKSPTRLKETKEEFDTLAKRYVNANNRLGEIEIRTYPKATPAIFPGTPRPFLHQGENLYYAGDWSATNLPPTLESAARAGWLAGKTVTESIQYE